MFSFRCSLVHVKRFQEVLEIIFSHTFFHTLIYQKASVMLVSEHYITFCAQIFKLPHVVLNQLGLSILFTVKVRFIWRKKKK